MLQVRRAVQLAQLSTAAAERERDAAVTRERETERQLSAAEYDSRMRYVHPRPVQAALRYPVDP